MHNRDIFVDDQLVQLLKTASSGSLEDIRAMTGKFIEAQQNSPKLLETIKSIANHYTDKNFEHLQLSPILQCFRDDILELFRKNPDDPNLARCFASCCSDSPLHKKTYLAYAQALEGACISPPPLLRATLHPGTRPLRVTFIADYVSPRVTRHMACAKHGGMTVQGIFKEGPAPYTTLEPCFYDTLTYYKNSSQDLDAIIQEITTFDADIVHMPTHLHVNETALALTCSLPFPLVGDAYDLLNIIFNKETVIKNYFEAQLNLECGWFRNVDGLCMRSRVIQFANRSGMLRKGTGAIYFPEVCFENTLNHTRLSDCDGKVHCIITGTMDYTFGECLSQLAPYIKDTNTIIHIVPTYYEKGTKNPQVEKICQALEKYSFFHFHNTMPHDQYSIFLGTMDILIDGIFIELPIYDREKTGESQAAIYSMGNRICDALEQDVLIMVSPLYKDRARLATVAHRAIIVRRNELLSTPFWRDLQTKVKMALQTQMNLEKLSPPYQSKRLERFYHSVMRRAVARRGVRSQEPA